MKYKFVFTFLFFSIYSNSQINIDSLDQLIVEAIDDDSRIKITQKICESYENLDPEINKRYIDKLFN